tara:strand:- start:821 stop:985 length:165 start_codon:yes stop_codon:yes gene_type:complete
MERFLHEIVVGPRGQLKEIGARQAQRIVIVIGQQTAEPLADIYETIPRNMSFDH